MRKLTEVAAAWLYPLKKRILFGILGILTVSIVLTTIFIFLALRDGLNMNSKIRTQELGSAIKSSLRNLMIVRVPDMIQNTLENLTKNNKSIVKAFLLDKQGKIVYSSDRRELGVVLDRIAEKSCHVCHRKIDAAPPQDTIILDSNGEKIYRSVMVIYNEKACYGCHAPTDRVNGKLIIDRSLQDTYALISLIELIIFGSGIVCLVLLVPFLSRVLSRGLDKYIDEIMRQNTELSLLYVMIERLSKTIDQEELKLIVIDIFKEAFEADEIDLVFPKDTKDYRAVTWSRTDNEIQRKKVSEGEALHAAIAGWMSGEFKQEEISDDGREIFMPIAKGDTPLALIVIRKTEAFKPDRVGLIKIMRGHVAVALENAHLYYIAITDELTRLYTQRHFRTSIEKKFSEFQKYGEKFTLLMLDIDDFKKINDTYGHVAGDTILRELAEIIQYSIRDNDLAFRYGGEEFAALLASTAMKGGKHVAERIRANIEAAVFEQGKHDIKVTISIGVSVCPDTAETVRDLILTADKLLYQAKKAGKNRVVAAELQED